jgi:NAD(P)-dependent dehydrogenase (short-subunit alcohol dehydrogenase family)
MDLHLGGKHALITGASKGIGRAVADVLAEEGCGLTMISRTQAALEEAAAAIRSRHQVNVRVIAADLSEQAEVERVANAAGEIDILVNNAGAIPPGTIADVDNARWRRAWDLKVFGYISLCRLIYPMMAARGSGVIVNIIGNAGERFDPGYIAGSTGNAGLMGFTRALGQAAPKDGLRVVGINPGPVATERMETMLRGRAAKTLGAAERWRELVAPMPFGRAATPEEIGNAVAFLASDRSGYTTGTILTIDGGIA